MLTSIQHDEILHPGTDVMLFNQSECLLSFLLELKVFEVCRHMS